MKYYESNIKNFIDNEDYILCKNRLEEIYDIKLQGAKIRSKSEWYEFGEKLSKFFLNLEKQRAFFK